MATSEPMPTATTLGIISKPLTTKLLQTVGLTTAAFLAGQTATVTTVAVPALMQTRDPALLARQWKEMFGRAMRVGPALMVVGMGVCGWMAWREPSTRTQSFRYYMAATLLYPTAVAYTVLTLHPTNNELASRAEGPQSQSTDTKSSTDGETDTTLRTFLSTNFSTEAPVPDAMSTHALVNKWAWLNLGRAGIFSAAALMGVWASVSEDLSFFELF